MSMIDTAIQMSPPPLSPSLSSVSIIPTQSDSQLILRKKDFFNEIDLMCLKELRNYSKSVSSRVQHLDEKVCVLEAELRKKEVEYTQHNSKIFESLKNTQQLLSKSFQEAKDQLEIEQNVRSELEAQVQEMRQVCIRAKHYLEFVIQQKDNLLTQVTAQENQIKELENLMCSLQLYNDELSDTCSVLRGQLAQQQHRQTKLEDCCCQQGNTESNETSLLLPKHKNSIKTIVQCVVLPYPPFTTLSNIQTFVTTHITA